MSTKIRRQNYHKIFEFTQTWRYNTKLLRQNKSKMRLLGFELSQHLNGVKVLWLSVFSFLRNCLEPMVKKDYFHENDFCHSNGNYSERAILKVSWYQLCSKFFSTVTRDIVNVIWKITYNWQFYGHWSAYVLILSWLNIMKQKNGRKSLDNYQLF